VAFLAKFMGNVQMIRKFMQGQGGFVYRMYGSDSLISKWSKAM
jgi:hypothetical protein